MEQIVVGQWYLLAGGEQVRVDALDDEAGLVSVTTSEGKALELLMTALNGARRAARDVPAQSADDAAYWSKVADLLDETEWQGEDEPQTDFDPLGEIDEIDGADGEGPRLDVDLEFDDEPGGPSLDDGFDDGLDERLDDGLDDGLDDDAFDTEPEPPLLQGLEAPSRPSARPEPPKAPEPPRPPERAEPVERPLAFDEPKPTVPGPAPAGVEASPQPPAGAESRLPLWLAAIAVLMVLGSSLYQQMQTDRLDERLSELGRQRAVQPPPLAASPGLDDEMVASVRRISEGVESLGERITRLRAEVANDGSQRAILEATVSELGIQIEGLRAAHNNVVGELRTHVEASEPVRAEAAMPVEQVAPVVSAPPAATTARPADPGRYAVVLLSLPTRERAAKALAEYEARGLPVVQRPATVDGREWQRLLVEGFATREEAAEYIARLTREYGIGGAWVMRR